MAHSYTADLGGAITDDFGGALVDDFGLAYSDDLGGPMADDFGSILVDDFGNVVVFGSTGQTNVQRSAGDYSEAFLNLLPYGPAWPRDEDSTLVRVVRALADIWRRLEFRAQDLLTESPAGDNLVEMLPEWEAALGLPDPCAGVLPTIALRQGAVRAHLAARGGQSIPYFVSVATALGVTISVTEFAPSRFGDGFGGRFGGNAWAYVWQVNAPQTRIVPFYFGLGGFGEPFTTWGDVSLECVLNRIKPAHTILLFSYSS